MIYIYQGEEYNMNSVIKHISQDIFRSKGTGYSTVIIILELLQEFYFPCEFVHMEGGKGLWSTISMCPELNPLFALKPNVGNISIYEWKAEPGNA